MIDYRLQAASGPLRWAAAFTVLCLAASHALAQAIVYVSDFEASEGYSVGILQGQNGWQVPQGSAVVTSGFAFSGTQSVSLTASTPPSVIAQSFSQFSGQSVIYIDFYSEPTANADPNLGTLFDVGPARAGFVGSGSTGQVYALNGDGLGGGSWVAATPAFPINSSGQAQNWIRLTFREDFSADTWSLYINGSLALYNLGFNDNSASSFTLFRLQAASGAGGAFDFLDVSTSDPLFTDQNNNGIDDAWEMKYLGTLSYGAGDDPGGVGRTLLQSYQQGLSPWPAAVVGSGLKAWYRADLGVMADSGQNVLQWTDLSGSGYHVVQSDASSRPVVAAGVFNGQPAVQFSGGRQVLLTSVLPTYL